uniref:Si:dkey-19b23.8 n=1 Tax=Mastacembelus armatus TaxID=205130 RepID=A0A3Q3KHZ7_9TELE
MSLGTFHLMQTLKNSPAALRRRFRRDRTESLSHGDPLFKVHYLGTEKIFSLDREQAQDAISHLLEGISNGKKLSKDHALVVRPRYVEVKELSTGRQLTKTYLQDIAYCAADANRPNVFLYICKHQGQQLQCRVFWCSRAERARDMTACLAHSFQRALNDWQQDGSATLPPAEAKGKHVESSSNSPTSTKSSTLPASLGKGEVTIIAHTKAAKKKLNSVFHLQLPTHFHDSLVSLLVFEATVLILKRPNGSELDNGISRVMLAFGRMIRRQNWKKTRMLKFSFPGVQIFI